LFSYLAKARKLAVAAMQKTNNGDARACTESIDEAFVVYNQACSALIEIVAKALEAVMPGSPEGRRAARRYRLFSTAAEQLGRERAFICGHGGRPQNDFIRMISEAPGSADLDLEGSTSTRLHRLSEIIGARKILLGTVADGASNSGDVVAASAGLLGTIMGEDEPSLLTPDDIAKLESLESRILNPSLFDPLPMEEWYQTITCFLKEIHSRIAINLLADMRLPGMNLNPPEDTDASSKMEETQKVPTQVRPNLSATTDSSCKAGLKRLLQSWADSL